MLNSKGLAIDVWNELLLGQWVRELRKLLRGEGTKYQTFPLPVYSSATQCGIVNTQVDVLLPRFYNPCRSQV